MTVTFLGLSSQEILDDFECIYVAFVENDELSKIRAFNLKDIHEKNVFLLNCVFATIPGIVIFWLHEYLPSRIQRLRQCGFWAC